MHARRTVEPGILLARALLQEETARNLEHEIPEKRGQAFILWCDRVLVAGVEGRALSEVLRIERKQLVYFFTSCVRKIVGGEVFAKLFSGPATIRLVQRLA